MGLFQCSTFFLAVVISFSVITTTKGSPNVTDARGHSISRGVHNGVTFANFKAHEFSYLNITSVGTDYVVDGEECGFACADISSCFSYNLASYFDINGRILCELLPSDKYNNSDKFFSNQSFHHFSILSPCMSGPCQNGGSCVPIYEKNSYQCSCVKGYSGSICQTGCPAGWVRHGKSCYYIDDTPTQTWSAARAACKGLGADLPIITSAEENKFIGDLVFNQTTLTWGGAWIGIQRKQADDKLYWIDGTPVAGGYTTWSTGNPSNSRGNEDCGHIIGKADPGREHVEKMWNDLPCALTAIGFRNKYPVILCEK